MNIAPNNAYGLIIRTPVLTAAGCFGFGSEYAERIDFTHIGAIVTRPIAQRAGGEAIQLIEGSSSLIWRGGANSALDWVLSHHLDQWNTWSTPVILAIADDHVAVATALDSIEGIAGVEVLVPNDVQRAARLIRAIRGVCLLPLLAKLTPHDGIRDTARAVVEAGADALTVCAAPAASAWCPRRNAFVDGRMIGPAILPLSLASLASLAATVRVPLIASGGIVDSASAQQCLAAGAQAVQLGSVLLGDPHAAARVGATLAATHQKRDRFDRATQQAT